MLLNNIEVIKLQTKYNGKNKLEYTLQNYWGNKYYFVNEKDSKEFDSLIKIITDVKYLVKKDDIIYASKANEVPRFKLKEFIKDNKLKKTSRYQYANVIIINRGYFNEMCAKMKEEELYFFNKESVKKYFAGWYRELNSYYKNNSLENDIIQLVEEDSERLNECFMVSKDNINHWPGFWKNDPSYKIKFDNDTHLKKGRIINLYREAKLQGLFELIYEMKTNITSGKCRIVWDEELFVELNKEGIELDDEYLKTLRNMLFSTDKSNIKLGFEMMSNLVITQPMLLSISFLLNELMYTTNFRPSYYTSNSNLKSLLKLLKTKGIRWECDWKTFGTGLRLNFKDGKEGDIVKQFLLDNINREFKLSNATAESLVDIVFTTEIK